MFDPNNTSDSSISFEDELLATTLVAVRRKRRLKTGWRSFVTALGIASIGWMVFQNHRSHDGINSPNVPIAQSSPPRIERITNLPNSDSYIIKTKPSLAEAYIKSTSSLERDFTFATDQELLASLEGHRLILIQDAAGKTTLRLLD